MTNLYSEYAEVSEETSSYLKRCFLQHMAIYNHCLSLLYTDQEIPFKKVKKYAEGYVDSKELTNVIKQPLANELFYQYKKFGKNIRVQKRVTDIHYLTFIGNGTKFGEVTITPGDTSIIISGVPGELKFTKPLPDLDRDKVYYLNVSYSNRGDLFKVTIFEA